MESTSSFFDKKLMKEAIKSSFVKLDPRVQWYNPVMFVTWLGALVVSVITVRKIMMGESFGFEVQIAVWLRSEEHTSELQSH